MHNNSAINKVKHRELADLRGFLIASDVIVFEVVATGGGAPCRVVCTTVTVGDACGGLFVLDTDVLGIDVLGVDVLDDIEDGGDEAEVVLARVEAGALKISVHCFIWTC